MGFFSKDSRIKKLVKGGKYGELVEQHLQGEVVVPEVITLLEDKEALVRGYAVLVLERIGEKDPRVVRQAMPRLITLLEDKEAVVRGCAAEALGRIGVVEALEKLRGLLSDSAKLYIPGEEKGTTVGKVAREAIERIEKR